jgi:acyl-CoA thioesterase I
MMAGILTLVGCGAAPGSGSREQPGADEQAVRAESPRRITFIGTSLTAGLGLDPDESYPAVIGRWVDSLDLNYEVVNAGYSGETSAGLRRRIGWVLSQPVDILVIETGANDGLRGLDPDSLRANLHALLDSVAVHQPEADVLLVGMEAPPNLGTRYTSRFREVFPQVARERQTSFTPFLLEGVAGVDTLNQADGIHPNPAGARLMAENVWRDLEPMARQRSGRVTGR